jgi:hypothetical protein
LPKGKPGCGFYRTIKSKPAPRTKKKRKAAQKPSSNKATRKRQRRESHSDSEGDSYSSKSEGDESASESGSDADSGDDRERGSIALQRTVTMDEEFIMERIVEGPRETDGKHRIRWEGLAPQHDTWEPAHHSPPEVLGECNNGSDPEGDDVPIASMLGV